MVKYSLWIELLHLLKQNTKVVYAVKESQSIYDLQIAFYIA